MRVGEVETSPLAARTPRAMAWTFLLASAFAVLLVGALATALIFGSLDAWPAPTRGRLWPRLLGACALTIVGLSLRSLRWIFLLRRSETRMRIRDAYVGYLAGLSLLFAPLFLGEIAVRAAVNRARCHVPIATTAVVNVWERALDFAALGVIAGAAGLLTGEMKTWTYIAIGGVAILLVPSVRRFCLRLVVAVVQPLTRRWDQGLPYSFERLASTRTWLVALTASLFAWTLPGVAFWLLAGAWRYPFSLVDAERAYASSAMMSGVALAPGGVLVAGREMLAALTSHGFPDDVAVLVVVAVRLATVGVSLVVGGVFVMIHLRSKPINPASHFDEIADAYDVQIPESRRYALLDRKTTLMCQVLQRHGIGPSGLDVGCGQGTYVVRMRELGFDVAGVDASPGQVRIAARKIGRSGLVVTGSVLDIPAPDGSYDFVYVINVLHHLASVEEQRRAFAELFRVLKPAGLLFVHEINTRNVLFRFYMGYVFPSLNCIDEGIERWLLPHRLALYTDALLVDLRYFTFLPDFVPRPIVRLLTPIERVLERSPLAAYSAHYMAVLRKPSDDR